MNSVKIFSKTQFSILWWSGTLSSFGDWGTLFASVALASYFGSKNGNSEITAVIPVVARIIPALLSTFAGLLADKFNKKNIMLLCDGIRMVIVMLLFFAESLIQLFLINFISEIFSLIRQPSREAVVPEVVNDEYLVKANSLFAIGTYASLPLASLIFGILSDSEYLQPVTSFGNNWSGSIIFLVDAVTFLLSISLLFFLKSSQNKFQNSQSQPVLNSLSEGIKYFWNNAELKIVSTAISISLLGAGSLFVLGNTYLTETLRFTQSSYGFMIASFGFGVVFIMVVLSYFVTSFSRVPFFIGISMTMTGLSLMFSFSSSEFSTILFFIFIAGIGSGTIYVLTLSYLQSTTTQALRGRVFGNFYSIARISLLISVFMSGFFANLANDFFNFDGVLFVLRISALLILLTGVYTFYNGYKKLVNEFGFENSNFNKLRLNLNNDEDQP